MVRVLNIVQFATETGGVTNYDIESFIHSSLRCRPQTKTFQRWYDRKLAELQQKRDETRAAYHSSIERGEIESPKPLSFEDTANGHPDNASTQAARRILEKRRLRKNLEQNESQPNGR